MPRKSGTGLRRGSSLKRWKLTVPGIGDCGLDLVLDAIPSRPHAGPLPWDEWQALTCLGCARLDSLARKKNHSIIRARAAIV